MNLDPRTVVMLTVLSTLFMSISLFAVARGYLAEMRGVTRWATGTLLQSAGWVFLALIGILPSYIAEIGSPLIMLGLAFYYHALVAFKESRVKVTWAYALVFINVLLIFYFLLVAHNMAARIVVASLTASVLMFASTRLLFSARLSKLPVSHSITGSLFAICSIVLLVRAVYYLVWNTAPDQSAFDHNIVQDIAFLTFFLAGVVSPFTFILMCNDRYNARALLRTRELAGINDELEEANRIKGQFLATMSHELRTPLNGVIGFLNQLAKTRLDVQQKDYLHTIDLSARMLLGVINDVLDYSKIEAGKLSIENIEINLREFMDEILAMFSVQAEDKNLDLICIYDHKIKSHLLGDPLRLTQILSNLLGNAIKFTEQGEVVIEIKQIAESERDVSLQLSVSDTGIGISQNSLDRLFQPFVQADASTTRKHGGTGLGLIIAKRLVEMMGGSIKAESEVWKGTRFTINIVLEKQVIDIRHALPALPNIRLLIVTENPKIANCIAEHVAALGISSESAGDGITAIASMNDAYNNGQNFDAVIFDSAVKDILPGEFSENIHKNSSLNHTQLLLLGNNADCQHADEMMNQTFGCYLKKPLKSTELFYELRKMFLPVQPESGLYPSIAVDSNATAKIKRLLGKRILIVDDNNINRKLIQLLVEEIGGEIDLAENGLQALDACSRKKFDLILMDVNMPVMDGLEATRRIRVLESNSHRTPIFALTANALPGDKERFIENGMDDYLSKPVNEKAMLNMLEKWFPQEDILSLNTLEHPAAVKISGNPVPVLDPELGVQLSFGDKETWHMVLALLLEDLPEYASNFLKVSSNKEQLLHWSHKLAGSSCYCGTPALHQAAKQVESNCLNDDQTQLDSSLSELNVQIERMLKLDAEGKIRGSNVVVY